MTLPPFLSRRSLRQLADAYDAAKNGGRMALPPFSVSPKLAASRRSLGCLTEAYGGYPLRLPPQRLGITTPATGSRSDPRENPAEISPTCVRAAFHGPV
jgi:hypothetical protein